MTDDFEKAYYNLMKRPMYFRRDGTPYPPGMKGLLAWTEDSLNLNYKIIEQTELGNGCWVSTVWLGLDHNFGFVTRPLIFGSMVFHKEQPDLECWRYSTEEEAQRGHKMLVKKWSSMKSIDQIMVEKKEDGETR